MWLMFLLGVLVGAAAVGVAGVLWVLYNVRPWA